MGPSNKSRLEREPALTSALKGALFATAQVLGYSDANSAFNEEDDAFKAGLQSMQWFADRRLAIHEPVSNPCFMARVVKKNTEPLPVQTCRSKKSERVDQEDAGQ